LVKKGITLEIACDNRQLHFFKRILSDYQCSKQKDLPVAVPGGLMLLRSAQLIWKKQKKSEEPWNTHHLYLHCVIDNQLWSKTGMEQVKLELIKQTEQKINICKAKEEQISFTQAQKQNLKRLETSKKRLVSFDISFLNPKSTPHPHSNPNIIIGVSIGLKVPVNIAIINLETLANLGFRSPKQLLSQPHIILAAQPEDKPVPPHRIKREVSNYQFFCEYLHLKHENQHKRHKAQKKSGDNQFGEANAGLYFNRLFAKAITEVAQIYQASVIVLPDLKNIREIIEAEIRARAELKYPGNKTLQKQYHKDFRCSVNQWNYNQLSQCIINSVAKVGLEIATIKQSTKGNPQQKARNLVLSYWEKQKLAAIEAEI
jgi:IS605 OrfB family transposase